MIYIKRNITVNNDISSIEKPVILYKGDKNVELQFNIKGNPFKFSDESEVAYAQLIIQRPDEEAGPIVSQVFKYESNTVVFVITGDMIDEFKELGSYTAQIRLFNSNRTSRVTLPPIKSGIVISEPIYEEDYEMGEVGKGTVDYSIVSHQDEFLDIFDEYGDYCKIAWMSGDLITDSRLNHIEDALYEINSVARNVSVDLSDYATTKYVDEALANIDISDVDLSAYATTESVNTALETKADADHTHDEYATTEYVGNKYVSNGALEQTLSEYATVQYVGDKYASKATLEEYATIKYVDNAISSVSGGSGADLSAYATKEDLNKAITVIDKPGGIGFDDFPKGAGIYKLNGSLEIYDINGNRLTGAVECNKEIIKVLKTDDDNYKILTVYTLDNKFIRFNIKDGTVTRHTYDVSREELNSLATKQELNSLATKEELNNALGDIESLLGGI